MEYLGGGSDTPYGAQRTVRGHSAPWTSAFARIHLEFGNEAWNSVYKGGNIESSVPYGNRGNELFGAAKSSPQYAPAKFNFVLGGQAGWVNRSVEIANASTNHDSILHRLADSDTRRRRGEIRPALPPHGSAPVDEARWLRAYVGKTGFVQLGWPYQGTMFLCEVSTEWYDRYQRLLDVAEEYGGIMIDEPDDTDDER